MARAGSGRPQSGSPQSGNPQPGRPQPGSPADPLGADPPGADPAPANPLGTADTDELVRILAGTHHDPHHFLGAHPEPGGTTLIRVLRPDARAVTVLCDGERHPLAAREPAGFFEGRVRQATPGRYRLEVAYDTGHYETEDPYRFLPTLGELDLHLIGEGRHERLWEVLGSHLRDVDGVPGASFAVWAPNARGVRVLGDFSFWDGRTHPMRSLGSSGIWELFVPGVTLGARYKYEVFGADGVRRQKADPMARATEVPPATASVVTTAAYDWGDADWMARRARATPHTEPMSIYEVHLASWRPGLDFRRVADELASYLVDLGFTHVELLPVAEHPFGGSWGYQVSSYYAPTARFGTPDDFRYFVDRMHRAGLGVLVDWVPAHFPKDDWALARFDGTPLYEHADPRMGEQPDWGTLVFNFGRREVRNFLVANALYWLAEFHVDGLRVDAVASMLYLDYSRAEGQWVPNAYGGRENLDAVSFLQEVNATAYREHPGVVTIAEESTAWPGVTRPTYLGGLGFGFKWNMGWMHDTLDYVSHAPIYRSYHHHQLTFSLLYAYSENFVLPLSHDEVVHGKGSLFARMPGDRWQQLANLRAVLSYMWAHPGKQLLFMGSEFGQPAEWSAEHGLDWWLLDFVEHQGIQRLVRDLNRIYRATPALFSADTDPAGFSWIDANDAANNVFSFVRRGRDGSTLACVANFAGIPHEGYRLGLPAAGVWDEVLNTDSTDYGGSGAGNFGLVIGEPQPWHGQPASVTLRLPPLGVLWLQPRVTTGQLS